MYSGNRFAGLKSKYICRHKNIFPHRSQFISTAAVNDLAYTAIVIPDKMIKQLIYKIIYAPGINTMIRTLNKAFSPILPNRIKIPPTGLMTIPVEGKKLKLYTNQTNFLTYVIFWEGYENWEYTDIFLSLVKKMNCFFDIGASIGFYSLLAAIENPKMNIVSFEPAMGPQFFFRKNIGLNHFTNIKLEPVALSHYTGNIDFYEVKNKKYPYLKYNLGGAGNAGSDTSESTFTKTNVPTITLDAYVKENHIQSIDLIKMDTEGTENLILENATYVLDTMKPIIICETLFHMIENELEEILIAHGYEFYNHTETGLEKVPSIRREMDNGIRNCFFVHPDKKQLIKEFIKPITHP